MGVLLDCFDEDVEYGSYVVIPQVRPVATMSGESTRKAETPNQHIQVSFSTWDSIANIALQKMKDKKYFSSDRSPKWNEARYIEVEGDVAEASGVYLLYAVDAVLCRYLPSATRFLSQHTINVSNYTVRADRVWGLGYPDGPGLAAYFAILDFKRPALINGADFGNSITWNGYCDMGQAYFQGGEVFTGNAHVLLKQAVGYSGRYGTKFVAFFDWDTLVLVVLADAEDLIGGDYCFITIITDRKKMRRALLGFLIRAYHARTAAVEDFSDLQGGDSHMAKDKPSKGKGGGGILGYGGGESSRRRGR